MINLAVFASGNGSNFEAIAEACQEGKIPAQIKILICDKPKAFVIERAKKYNILTKVIVLKKFASKEDYEKEICSSLSPLNIDLICLAGYMKLCNQTLLEAYPNKIINIHPALLPAFKGAHAILDAFNYGVKVYGVTIHYVSPEVDGGKIISQATINYKDGDTLDEIENKIHALEHVLYVDTINKLIKEGL